MFDDRLSIPIDDQDPNVEPISTCTTCGVADDTYYNCANTDCNNLFISCKKCVADLKGCCSKECASAPRIRTFSEDRGNKPFRRKHLCSCTIEETAKN